MGTAVKVTVRTDAASGGATSLFFGRLFGLNSVNQQASAVAAVNPRDIAFVVDLSGSMNDDTDPGRSRHHRPDAKRVRRLRLRHVSRQFGGLKSSKIGLLDHEEPDAVGHAERRAGAGQFQFQLGQYWGAYFDYVSSNGLKLGYQSYLQFMMWNGRDGEAGRQRITRRCR